MSQRRRLDHFRDGGEIRIVRLTDRRRSLLPSRQLATERQLMGEKRSARLWVELSDRKRPH